MINNTVFLAGKKRLKSFSCFVVITFDIFKITHDVINTKRYYFNLFSVLSVLIIHGEIQSNRSRILIFNKASNS